MLEILFKEMEDVVATVPRIKVDDTYESMKPKLWETMQGFRKLYKATRRAKATADGIMASAARNSVGLWLILFALVSACAFVAGPLLSGCYVTAASRAIISIIGIMAGKSVITFAWETVGFIKDAREGKLSDEIVDLAVGNIFFAIVVYIKSPRLEASTPASGFLDILQIIACAFVVFTTVPRSWIAFRGWLSAAKVLIDSLGGVSDFWDPVFDHFKDIWASIQDTLWWAKWRSPIKSLRGYCGNHYEKSFIGLRQAFRREPKSDRTGLGYGKEVAIGPVIASALIFGLWYKYRPSKKLEGCMSWFYRTKQSGIPKCEREFAPPIYVRNQLKGVETEVGEYLADTNLSKEGIKSVQDELFAAQCDAACDRANGGPVKNKTHVRGELVHGLALGACTEENLVDDIRSAANSIGCAFGQKAGEQAKAGDVKASLKTVREASKLLGELIARCRAVGILESNKPELEGKKIKGSKWLDLYRTEDGYLLVIKAEDGSKGYRYMGSIDEIEKVWDDEMLNNEGEDVNDWISATKQDHRDRIDDQREADMHRAGFQDRNQQKFEEGLFCGPASTSGRLEAVNSVDQICEDNLALVRASYGKIEVGGFVVGGKVFLPIHVVSGKVTTLAYAKENYRGAVITITGRAPLKKDGSGGGITTITKELSEFTSVLRKGVEVTDVMCAGVSGMRSMKHNIAIVGKVDYSNATMVTINSDLKIRFGSADVKGLKSHTQNPLGGAETTESMWLHNVSTSPGDCGSLLMAPLSTKGNHRTYYIIGWHMWGVVGNPSLALNLQGVIPGDAPRPKQERSSSPSLKPKN